ncbi:hypothetical protein ACFWVM_29460 [Nocardia fluminea]|uniref:hypothetical protein n=1 Tax=Nocardia TaxID=1817 RepID=UPI003652C1FD
MELLNTLPPRVARASGRPASYLEEAAELEANKGQWGRVMTCATPKRALAQASAIRKGNLVAFQPAGTYEADTRDTAVWARYIPETERNAL